MQMSREQAKDYINGHPEFYLRRDRQGKGFVCPFCNNGSSKDGDGDGLSINKKSKSDHIHLKCFKCQWHGDMIDMFGKLNGVAGDSKEAFEFARKAYGIEIDGGSTSQGGTKTEVEISKPEILQSLKRDDANEENSKAELLKEARSYVLQCSKYIEEKQSADYLKGRCIPVDLAKRFYLGYDASKNAIVIPTNRGFFVRYISDKMKMRYQNANGLEVGLFNLAALNQTEKPVFVHEGCFDALSTIAQGYEAVALNSTSNADLFLKAIDEMKANNGKQIPKILVSMDNDDAGRAAAETLVNGLNLRSVAFNVVDVTGGHKDANEALQADSEAFKRALFNACYSSEIEAVNSRKVGALLPGFKEYIRDGERNYSIPTGFEAFDRAIGGGLYPKLYVIGAISSLGKTTFCLQITDWIAQSGRDVCIFSLEMAKEDLIARSISRQTYMLNKAFAKTELGIASYEKYANYSDMEKQIIRKAFERYSEFASDRISIYEGRHSANQIRQTVEQYIRVTGKKPVVLIDYLQLCAPCEEVKRASVREQVDFSIDVFTAMRRELKIPVVVISSFNRSSYSTSADNSSFKESSGIEYSADCTISLELDIERKKTASNIGVTNETKEKILEGMRGNSNGERIIKLTFQKNRGNKLGGVIRYRYSPAYNYFEEMEEGTEL